MGFNPIDLALGNMDALRVSNERLKKENAKLREELDFCLKHVPNCDGCEAMLDCWECLRADSSQKERKRLDYENIKLRELVQDVMPIVCDGCHEHLCKMPKEEHPFITCWFADRMCELGIEV